MLFALIALQQEANYYGSLTQASTTSLGVGPDGREVYIPVKDLLPMVNPNDIEFDGESKLSVTSKPQESFPLTFLWSMSYG